MFELHCSKYEMKFSMYYISEKDAYNKRFEYNGNRMKNTYKKKKGKRKKENKCLLKQGSGKQAVSEKVACNRHNHLWD